MANYDVWIEIDYFGDELNAVFHKEGQVNVYPLDEVRNVVERLEAGGAEVIDKTVYSQTERMTWDEYKDKYGEEPDYLRY